MTKSLVFLINSLDGGGAERVVSTLMNSLVDNYECHLILIENKISFHIDDRINIIILNENSNKNGLLKFIRLPIIAFKLSKIIKENNFKKVLSFLNQANYINVIAKYFSKHIVILNERISTSSIYSDISFKSFVNKYLVRLLYSKSDLVLSCSQVIRRDLKNKFDIKARQEVIYNPYNIDKILDLAGHSVEIDIQREKTIISVGSLEKRKNIDSLILSFSNIEDKSFSLFILGKGSEEKNLRCLVEKLSLNDRVFFLEFDNNPYKYLSKCGIFVLNSNSEGFPNALVEAMVCGCCVISSDCSSGPREILAPRSDIDFINKKQIEFAEFGILVPVNNVGLLTKAIDSIDKNVIANYKYISRARVDDFNLEIICLDYIKAIESCC